MRRLGSFIAYFIITLVLILFFLPKVNLYYKAETLLEKYKITISGEKLLDRGLSFKIQEGLIYFDDLVVAKIDEISIVPLLAYNSLHVKPFSFSEDMKQFIPLKVDNLNITQTLINPLHVRIESSGEFGSLEGDIALKDRNISLILRPSKLLLKQRPFWMKELKKDAQGGYRYESNY